MASQPPTRAPQAQSLLDQEEAQAERDWQKLSDAKDEADEVALEEEEPK